MSEFIDNMVQEIDDSDRSQSSAWHGRAVQAVRLYQITFNRVPDRTGLDYWTSMLDGRQSFGDVATRFIDNPEFNSLYGSWTPRSIYHEFLANALGSNRIISKEYAWRPEFETHSAGQLLAKLAQASEISTFLKPYIGVFLDGLHNRTENYIGSLLLRHPPMPADINETDVADEPQETSPSLSNALQEAPPSDQIVNASIVPESSPEPPQNAVAHEAPGLPDTSPPLTQTPDDPRICRAAGSEGAANSVNWTEHVISSSHQHFVGTPFGDFIRAPAYIVSNSTERPRINSTVLSRNTVDGCAGHDILSLEMSETVVDAKLISIEELWIRPAEVVPQSGLNTASKTNGALINGYGFGELRTLKLDSLSFPVKVPNLDSDVSVHIRNAAHSTTLDFRPAKTWFSERDIHIAGQASDLHFNRASWLKLTIGEGIMAPIGLDSPNLLTLRIVSESDIALNLSHATTPSLRRIDATGCKGSLVLHYEKNWRHKDDIETIEFYGSAHGSDFCWQDSKKVTVRTGNGTDLITTGSGDDTIYAGGGHNIISTGSGKDRIVIEKASQSTLGESDDNMTVIYDFDPLRFDRIELPFLKRTDCADLALLRDIQSAINTVSAAASLHQAHGKAVELTDKDGWGWFAFNGNSYIFADNSEHTLIKIVGLHDLELQNLGSGDRRDHWPIII
ncbi:MULTISPECIES: DUF4214 domain-containing protein [unclassified Chelatococcus]|uniref:DUF4214 domain-containing protein n=1 Tax=unclassified Chelatococcus TaxID=2638111 RepID=UPI001BCBB94D|nr:MULTISPECIES: DUF4214 domain-containing protein [unclassified Chelatococcus]CAH1666194.1 hypothetical protein CHELA41_22786 [Hyphomicrobiales bacterium]MBS7737826.1 DUF4214 domain-containing protein [Chelatococcus sp. HY11]MBX3546726.1 DUF4214 domain-containing protein [Chelatococcus sp.]MCO5079280.1 DUF4214 domain-containing protein [Chelatococcus sp.]CAH1680797.1 hypothetical protein CHELA20_52134 [Hyphomicrobiales bacterium]